MVQRVKLVRGRAATVEDATCRRDQGQDRQAVAFSIGSISS